MLDVTALGELLEYDLNFAEMDEQNAMNFFAMPAPPQLL